MALAHCRGRPSRWETTRTGIETACIAGPAGITGGTVFAGLFYFVIRPSCEQSGMTLCGLNEAIIATIVGGVASLLLYLWFAYVLIRRWFPSDAQRGPLLALCGVPAGIAVVASILVLLFN